MRAGAIVVAVGLAAGCASRPPSGEPAPAPTIAPVATTHAAEPSPGSADLPEPRLPRGSRALAPSELSIEGTLRGEDLFDVEACAPCHADVVTAFRTSAHAFASFNNPIYRYSIDRFREDAGKDKSRFCAGCHDVALLVDGAMDREVLATDRRAHAGITCRTCHGVVRSTADGNGSYVLTAEPVPFPKLGDADSVKRHVERVGMPALRQAETCGACHKVFLGPPAGNAHHLAGQDDLTPWMRSAFAGSNAHRLDVPIAEQDCRGCHMPLEPAKLGDQAATEGKIASHRFLGAHTWLASMRKDPDALERQSAMLRGSVSIDVAAVIHEDGKRDLPADGAAVRAGERVVLDVVLRNQRVGHRFPGGTLDAQDAWIEIEVRDAGGRLVAEAGAAHEKSGEDPSAHRLRALIAGDDGRPLMEREVNRFRAVVFNHTLLPREAAVVEYALEIPADVQAPVSIRARLRHRTRSLPVQAAACAAHATKRGKAFYKAAGTTVGNGALDPCAPQPVVDIADTTVLVGAGSDGRSPPGRPAWERLYDHALGLSRVLQERLDEGRPSLERALELLGPGGPARERAMLHAGLGYLAGRQGRTDEALGHLERAEALLPGDPALAHLRGEALANVWRWPLSVAPFERAASGAPRDDAGWAALALARGSAGDDRGALQAAIRGLVLQPRDPDLLRIQALSLRALGAPDGIVEAARTAYLDHRVADDAPAVRARCSAKVPGCALERNPVHVHALRAPRD